MPVVVYDLFDPDAFIVLIFHLAINARMLHVKHVYENKSGP